MSGWYIIGDMATRRVNGRDVRITAGDFPSMQAAIENWEAGERARQAHDLREMGRLVDDAIARLQRHRAAERRDPPR